MTELAMVLRKGRKRIQTGHEENKEHTGGMRSEEHEEAEAKKEMKRKMKER